MFKHRLGEDVSYRVYLNWFILSFLAGNVNAGGFLACSRFVSHVTGFATLAGISLKDGRVLETIGVLTIPGYFLGGVMISGYLTEKKRLLKKEEHRYSLIMGLVAICLAIVTLAGVADMFGPFGETANLKHDYFLLALLCGACGLQNAAITSATGATIRTTHLTGLTTDLGLGLVRAFANKDEKIRETEYKANTLRILTIVSFMGGSFIGALFYSSFHYLGFAIPTMIAIYVSGVTLRS